MIETHILRNTFARIKGGTPECQQVCVQSLVSLARLKECNRIVSMQIVIRKKYTRSEALRKRLLNFFSITSCPSL